VTYVWAEAKQHRAALAALRALAGHDTGPTATFPGCPWCRRG